MEPNTSLNKKIGRPKVDNMGFNILLISFKFSCHDLLAQIDSSVCSIRFSLFFWLFIVKLDEWGKILSVLE